MSKSPSERDQKLWLLPALLTGVATSLLAVFWFALQPNLGDRNGAKPKPAGSSPKLSREDSLRLIELRNRSIGYLENHEFSLADKALSEIIQIIPTDPFGPRNLAICRQLGTQEIDRFHDQDVFNQANQRAEEAVELSKSAEPKSFVPWVIASRVAIKNEQTEVALADLREAARLSPDSVGPPYDIFSLLQSTRNEQSNDEEFHALQKVYEKEPNNLFVIKDLLPLLVERKDPDFVAILKQVRETLAPFVDTIKTNTRIDINDFMDKSSVAAKEGNWPVAQRTITILKNVILSEAPRDKRYVTLDSLEYLLPDFGEDFRTRADLSATSKKASNPVHFLQPGDPANWPTADTCRGIVPTDFDLDGQLDLILLHDDRIVVWRRNSNDRPWEEFAKSDSGGLYAGILAFDLDDDISQDPKAVAVESQPAAAHKNNSSRNGHCHTADPDLVLFGPAGLKLFENKKEIDSKARSVLVRSGGSAFDEVRDVIAATAVDIDTDGDLDLVVSTGAGMRILSNRGNLTFDDISARSILPPPGEKITTLGIVDWDRDSDVDVLVATASGVGWLENVRHGRVRYRSLNDFPKLSEVTSIKIGDFDGNTSWDFVAAGPNGASVVMTDRTPAGLVSVRKTSQLTLNLVTSAAIGDFDNDGTSDVLVQSTDGATLFSGSGMGEFAEQARPANDWLKDATNLAVIDLDRDGDIDLITAGGPVLTFQSNQCRETDNPNHGWMEIQLVSDQVKPGEQNWEKRTNHINRGGLLELKSGELYQAAIVTDTVTHFGLGSNPTAEIVRILWTNGIPMNTINPAQNEFICLEQVLAGSCPYLYAWNGERFEFVTDLLWNAPLGLKFAETVIAPWREWEYLKIDGNQLKGLDGEYPLRVTAELWEAEYFDQIKLFAVDHPIGTEIFTNEKVGPASIAEPKIHTVQNSRKPVAARDTLGRDVLPQVISRDHNYTKTFDKTIAQGLTEEHFLELDLGEFPDAKQITLFLTGWMYPGTTSLSVQFSQNPEMPKPRPPALYTPDANGEWREVRPYMGFPGGKTKTIAVDVSHVFTNGDHRLRIVSRMEIFWDSVFFTVDDPTVDFVQTELQLTRASLVDRGGVSFRSWPPSGNGPDQFDYSNLIPGEHWPAMAGNFTRFGDVLPLLTERDDHLVVTGSGDEIQLAFAEPTNPIPTGWTRDFVLYTVGWDKDADLNTVYGDTVEPIPFEAMTVYALENGEPRPLDPEYVQYLRQYQTRQRNPSRFWKSIQRIR